MNEKGSIKNSSSVTLAKKVIEKLLPWAIIGVISFGIEMFAWRIEVNDKLKAIPSIEWKTTIDGQLEHQNEQIKELKEIIKTMKTRMDLAMSTGAAGHLTHREFNIAIQQSARGR